MSESDSPTTSAKHDSRAARLRALDRLLRFSVIEAEELDLREVARLLALASASLPAEPKAPSPDTPEITSNIVVNISAFRRKDA